MEAIYFLSFSVTTIKLQQSKAPEAVHFTDLKKIDPMKL